MIGAAFFYGLSSFVVKGRYGTLAAVQTSWISVTVAGRADAPARRSPRRPGHTPALGAIAALVALGVVGTALAFVIFYELINGIGAGARRARLLPRPGRRAVLRRHLPRRDDHRRRDRRPGADPRRRGDRLAAQAGPVPVAAPAAGATRPDSVLVSARVDLTLSPAEEEFRDDAARLDRREPPGHGAGGRRGRPSSSAASGSASSTSAAGPG